MVRTLRVDEPLVARSVSFFWYKRIYLGNKWDRLPTEQRDAVIAHELGHCLKHHTEWRALALFFPFFIPSLCRHQEFEADAYACEQGHGPALHKLLGYEAMRGPYHPTNFERRQKLVHNKFFARPS